VGFKEIFEFVGKAIDGAGVAVIALGICTSPPALSHSGCSHPPTGTFLSFTLEVELEGRWPWQRPTTTRAAAPSSD
jgi:hypothetical protein